MGICELVLGGPTILVIYKGGLLVKGGFPFWGTKKPSRNHDKVTIIISATT